MSNERIEELQEKRKEFILNESVYEDDNPSWEEVSEAEAEAEARWNETKEGRELKALLWAEGNEKTMSLYYALEAIQTQLKAAWGRAHYEEIRIAMHTARAAIAETQGE